ncbi:hypothetical protein K431DRAFT_292855 [Polychaeton citri CBS 116435]|uniref:Trafficking protein particle complex subunit 12 n=1 Tax=Polychaeton citri CBS 116435 TaxID=1314669 RepID=A0A9P4URU3_9PEZI|nr:hypothetical protein K431DRAFT_292855 [Polychaeton citri CBS 116435]
MSSQRPPSGTTRRSGRNISHPLQRTSTTGPLDGNDPLAETDAPVPPQPASPLELSPPAQAVRQSLPPSPLNEPVSKPPPQPSINVRFLQDRGIYHALATGDISSAFLDSAHQPPLDTPLHDLLEHGHFRRAAERAAEDLLRSVPDQVEEIFRLLYTRLACLVLVSRPDLAAQEAFPLTDVLARNTPGASDLLPLVPWELRILLVRLQSIGAADGGRRGIMALYALGGEARAQLKAARDEGDTDAVNTWNERLRDLGLRAADTLVEMGELETASRHLDTLMDIDQAEITYRKSLLRLRVGDTLGAKAVIADSNEAEYAALHALIQVAEGGFSNAADQWQSLQHREGCIQPEIFAQNFAVCLLYTGQIEKARTVLEGLSRHSSPFSALLFNLSTVYELCSEKAVDHKQAFIHMTAQKPPTAASEGWERANVEFKL